MKEEADLQTTICSSNIIVFYRFIEEYVLTVWLSLSASMLKQDTRRKVRENKKKITMMNVVVYLSKLVL